MSAGIITARGDIDISCERALKRIASQLADMDYVVADIGEVQFVDTTFLRFLIILRRQARRTTDEPLRLVRPGPSVQRLLEVTGLRMQFAYYDTVANATYDASTARHFAPITASAAALRGRSRAVL